MSTPGTPAFFPPEWGHRVAVFEHPDVLASPNQSSAHLPRFNLRTLGIAVDTLADTQRAFEEVRGSTSAMVGATVFGSVTKGYATRDSDLDVCLYFDAIALGHTPTPQATSQPTMIEFDTSWPIAYGTPTNAEQFELRKSATERLGRSDDTRSLLPRSIEVVPLHPQLLKLAADKYASDATNLSRYQELRAQSPHDRIEAIADWSTVSRSSEVLAWLPGLTDVFRDHDLETGIVDVLSVQNLLAAIATDLGDELSRLRAQVFWGAQFSSQVAPRLFGLALNSGLEPYRAEFLRAVGESTDPDAAWGYFVSKLAEFENSPKQPRDVGSIAYPVEFEAATKLYGRDL
ncbi:nucleotidyltransferase domain-containing protein [Candidatus Saccharibacteria bacterium]|nr:nucleotidyltransferase domain-containing protein [Candidatus Saccharibacteria bacterium]